MNESGTVAVVGAGTMGRGIAQLAAQAGRRTLLHDPIADALSDGVARIGRALDRQVEKGRMSAAEAAAVAARVEPVSDVADLAGCAIAIEVAPERLELKLDLFGRLAEIVSPECVLATNTSSLSVTEIAAGVPGPERVVGMHFFNPAPVMKLVEVVAGEVTSDAALDAVRQLGEAMGKHVIDAADIAGFLVNRCNRPYSLESLKLVEERVATVEQVDRVARLAGGFRMGPFELMDLIGIETNHAVAESFRRASYGEPRYRPSPLAARRVAAGHLGRKTGRGWYVYDSPDGGAHRPPDPEPPAPGGGDGRVVIVSGSRPIADELMAAAADAGFDVWRPAAGPAEAWLTLDVGPEPHVATGPVAKLLADGSLHALAPHAAGFHTLPPFDSCRLVEVTTTELTEHDAAERLEALIGALGRHSQRVGDAPGLVLGRIVAQLVNEAAFLLGEGNGTPEDVDAGLELGVNHPRGPIAWSEAIGMDHVIDILDALHRELGEERYRVAPLLRRRAAVGRGLSARATAGRASP